MGRTGVGFCRRIAALRSEPTSKVVWERGSGLYRRVAIVTVLTGAIVAFAAGGQS